MIINMLNTLHEIGGSFEAASLALRWHRTYTRQAKRMFGKRWAELTVKGKEI